MAYEVDSYTKLLIHFDGTDGDTADQTAETGQTITLWGDAQLDTAQKKFGTASLLLDGTGDYATVPDHADWNFGTDDFTVDFWVKLNSTTGIIGLCGQYVDPTHYWAIEQNSQHFYFIVNNGASSKIKNSVSHIFNTGTWYHVEFCVNGTTSYLFLNGVPQTLEGDYAGEEVPDLAAALEVGASRDHTYVMNGWIDEFRISKGIARHTANFIPPNEASFLVLF